MNIISAKIENEGVKEGKEGGIYLTPVRSSQLKNKSIYFYLREKNENTLN